MLLDRIPACVGLLIDMVSLPHTVLARRLLDAPLPSGHIKRRRRARTRSAFPSLRRVPDEPGSRDVPRGALGEPRFLDLHLPHAAYGTHIRARVERGRRGDRVHRRARLSGCHRDLPEELPTPRELDLAPPICEEPKVPHPLEALNAVHYIKGFGRSRCAAVVTLPVPPSACIAFPSLPFWCIVGVSGAETSPGRMPWGAHGDPHERHPLPDAPRAHRLSCAGQWSQV
jgi:hypothetical protein